MRTLLAIVGIVIAFVYITSPERETVQAQPIITMDTVTQFQNALESIKASGTDHADQLKQLADDIQTVRNQLVPRDEVTKLITTAVQEIPPAPAPVPAPAVTVDPNDSVPAAQNNCNCSCNCADIEKQLKELKALVEARTAACGTTITKSSYSCTGSAPVVKSCGSTGSAAVSSSSSSSYSYSTQSVSGGGSTGSAPAPAFQPLAAVRASVRNMLSLPRHGTHWTYPGPLNMHLLDVEHAEQVQKLGIDINTLSADELHDLHDSLHMGELPHAGPVRIKSVQRTNFSMSGGGNSCPGGNCPTASASSSTRFNLRSGGFLGKFRGR